MSAEIQPKKMVSPKLSHLFTESAEIEKEIQQKHLSTEEPGSHLGQLLKFFYVKLADLVLELTMRKAQRSQFSALNCRYSDNVINIYKMAFKPTCICFASTSQAIS